jgi:nucleoid DNA-binding protein
MRAWKQTQELPPEDNDWKPVTQLAL